MCGTIGYLCYWPNPFSFGNFARGTIDQPRLLYRDGDTHGSRLNTYELTSPREATVFDRDEEMA